MSKNTLSSFIYQLTLFLLSERKTNHIKIEMVRTVFISVILHFFNVKYLIQNGLIKFCWGLIKCLRGLKLLINHESRICLEKILVTTVLILNFHYKKKNTKRWYPFLSKIVSITSITFSFFFSTVFFPGSFFFGGILYNIRQ